MKRWILIAALVVSTACASLSVKQKVSNAHLTIHAALVAVDDAELAVCQPDPVKPALCTAEPRVISDGLHQRLSGQIASAFAYDAAIGRAIIAWQPNSPMPKDLPSLKLLVEQIRAVVDTLPDSVGKKKILDALVTVAEAIEAVSRAFGGSHVA